MLPQVLLAILREKVLRRKSQPANPDSDQAAAVERQRTIRWLGLAIIMLVLVLGTAGLIVFDRTTGKIADFMDRMIPDTYASAEVQTALNEVRLPNSLNLVEGLGTSSATLETLKLVFGHRVPGAGSHTHVNIEGSIMLTVPGKAITLSARQNRGDWVAVAVVNVDQLQVMPNTKVTDQAASDGFGRRIGAVVVGSDAAKRLKISGDLAATSFQKSCAPHLRSALAAGTEAHVQEHLRISQGLLAHIEPSAAEILGELAARPVTVIVQQNGKPVAPEAIKLRLPALPHTQDVATQIGAKPEQVAIRYPAEDDCKPSPKAEAQLREYAKNHPVQ